MRKISALAEQKKQVICLFVLRYFGEAEVYIIKHILCSNRTGNAHSLEFILLLCNFSEWFFWKMLIADHLPSIILKRCTDDFATWRVVVCLKWMWYLEKLCSHFGENYKIREEILWETLLGPLWGIPQTLLYNFMFRNLPLAPLASCDLSQRTTGFPSIWERETIPCNVQEFFLMI